MGTLRDWAAFFIDVGQRAVYELGICEQESLIRPKVNESKESEIDIPL